MPTYLVWYLSAALSPLPASFRTRSLRLSPPRNEAFVIKRIPPSLLAPTPYWFQISPQQSSQRPTLPHDVASSVGVAPKMLESHANRQRLPVPVPLHSLASSVLSPLLSSSPCQPIHSKLKPGPSNPPHHRVFPEFFRKRKQILVPHPWRDALPSSRSPSAPSLCSRRPGR